MYNEALSLAQVYQLNTDMIYQRQWASVPVSQESIRVTTLATVSHKSFFLHLLCRNISIRYMTGSGFYGSANGEFHNLQRP